MTEKWKPVKGFEGMYEVSNTGFVRSIDRIKICKDGKRKKFKGKELFFTVSKIDSKGHLPRARVQLWKDNKPVLKQVHRLVAMAFIPNPEGRPTVNHIDGNPLNNNADNLEWATFSENEKHAYKLGLMKPRANSTPPNSRRVIARNLDTGDEIIRDTCAQMARELGVCHQRVSECAAENERVQFSTCKGYVIQYL